VEQAFRDRDSRRTVEQELENRRRVNDDHDDRARREPPRPATPAS
jgi:hypothetical protein